MVMVKRHCILVVLVFSLCLFGLLSASCGANTAADGSDPSPEVPQDLEEERRQAKLMWNGLELTHEDFDGSAPVELFVPENVLTTDDEALTVFFLSKLGSDVLEYGVTEVIQVQLDGLWYTLPFNLSQSDEPLVLPGFSHEMESLSIEYATEHAVDLSITGGLPPGRYRLVERFSWERLQDEGFAFANFWVINPGDARPPESEVTGEARMEDIVFNVSSPFEARRAITDQDDVIAFSIENLSGKTYDATSATLERRDGDQWVDVGFEHANLGLVWGWEGSSDFLFLRGHLEAGDYRLRVSMRVFETQPVIEPEYEFAVVAHEHAPKAAWDSSRLRPSPYEAADQSTGVAMAIEDPVINKRNTTLALTVTADAAYSFGEPYEIEVLLDGTWYSAPMANAMFNMPAYGVGPNEPYEIAHDLLHTMGVMPAGQYRIIKEFDLVDPKAPWDEVSYLAKEFAIAEFTVEESIG